MTDYRDESLGGPEYQGWQNRETWAASLWLTNDESTYREARGIIADAIESAGDDVGDWTGANALEDWFSDMIDASTRDDGIMLASPMIREIGSVWRVNWREVADQLID